LPCGVVIVTGLDMTTTDKRKTLSKKIRFEVFKRDSFTCQYCGAKAPDVILHVDHIEPWSKGGSNDIINLVTSCSTCNLGKGANTLSDDSVVVARRQEAESRQARLEQLEMMRKWHEDMNDLFEVECDVVTSFMLSPSYCKSFRLNDLGMNTIRQLIRRFGVEEVLASIGISLAKYIVIENGKATHDSFEDMFEKIGGICFNRKRRREEGKSNV